MPSGPLYAVRVSHGGPGRLRTRAEGVRSQRTQALTPGLLADAEPGRIPENSRAPALRRRVAALHPPR